MTATLYSTGRTLVPTYHRSSSRARNDTTVKKYQQYTILRDSKRASRIHDLSTPCHFSGSITDCLLVPNGEIRCYSGIWRPVDEASSQLVNIGKSSMTSTIISFTNRTASEPGVIHSLGICLRLPLSLPRHIKSAPFQNR